MQSQTCPEHGCCCDYGRPCCRVAGGNIDHLGERGGCRRIDPQIIERVHPSFTVGPLLPCGLWHCRAFGLCGQCVRNRHGWI